MTETELKFQVPEAARAAVRRAVATPKAQRTRLRARYFDTADRRLAAAGVALRLRLEGRQWVQTLKGARAGLAQRLEHEVRLPAGPVELDLRRHDGTPAAEALRDALGADAPPLQMVFETDVRRTHRVLRSGGAMVELALDIGTLRAGGRRLPVWELEFELQRGPLRALVDLAGRWVQRHGLWLDVRSKAERGELLARGLAVRPPTGYRAPRLDPAQPMDDALRAMLAAALAQALPNAAALAGGVGEPEHLHQLRVGLRRLRSVLQLFDDVDPDDEAAAAQRQVLSSLFRALGAARDRDALAASVLPALAAAGGPALALPPSPPAVDAGALLRQAGSTRLLMGLLARAEGAPAVADTAGPAEPVAAVAAQRLRRLHRRLAQAAADFASLDTEQQHRLRRRIKRLRYGVEATQSLWPAKTTRRYLDALRPLQDALGLCNDLQVALDTLPLPDDAAGGFAHGWLVARRDQALQAAAQALQRWPRRPRAWR